MAEPICKPLPLHPSEASAMRLDGELFPLADAHLPLDRLVGSRERALAIAHGTSARLIIAGRSAAWVHECARLPRIQEFCCLPHARADAPFELSTVRARSLRLTETVTFDEVRVTDVVRTGIDLLGVDDAIAARLLAQHWQEAHHRAVTSVRNDARRRLRALRQLAASRGVRLP